MRPFKLRIEFTDGTGKVLDYVNKTEVRNDVLWAWQETTYSGIRTHLGSWPLVNVKEWKTEDL